jgi:hypothetical protein
MHPRYGWPLAGRYCTCAGFSNLPWGVAVTLSFGQCCEKKRAGIHFSENCDGEDAGESTLLQQSPKSDFFPTKTSTEDG